MCHGRFCLFTDKLDGVRKCRKRAYSGEVDDEEELTLSEYLKRKAAEFTGVGHRRKKRVSLQK